MSQMFCELPWASMDYRAVFKKFTKLESSGCVKVAYNLASRSKSDEKAIENGSRHLFLKL